MRHAQRFFGSRMKTINLSPDEIIWAGFCRPVLHRICLAVMDTRTHTQRATTLAHMLTTENLHDGTRIHTDTQTNNVLETLAHTRTHTYTHRQTNTHAHTQRATNTRARVDSRKHA